MGMIKIARDPCVECKGTGVCPCPFCEGSCSCGFDPSCYFCEGKGTVEPWPHHWNQSEFSYASRAERNELAARLRAFVEKHKLGMRVVVMRKRPVVKIVCRTIPRRDLPWDPTTGKLADPGYLYAAEWHRYRTIVGERSDVAAVRRLILDGS